MVRVIFCLGFVSFWVSTIAQPKNNLLLQFVPVYAREVVRLDSGIFICPDSSGIQIETFRFYISRVSVYKNEKLLWTEPMSFHLLDAAIPASLKLSLVMPAGTSFDQISFNLGVDSFTNVSGALGGDLDPSRGMYWTWQSGYINWKLEGTAAAAPTRNHEFHFHIGGYSAPFATLTPVILKVDNQQNVNVFVDLHRFLNGIDLKTENNIMIPGHNAVRLAKKAGTIFYTNP
jgi:hypothetical protein